MGVEVCSPDRSRWPTFAHSQASALALERAPSDSPYPCAHVAVQLCLVDLLAYLICGCARSCMLPCAAPGSCRWVAARLAPSGPYLTRSRSLQLGSLTPGRFGLGQGGQFEGVLRAHARPHAHRLLQRLARRVALLVARVCVWRGVLRGSYLSYTICAGRHHACSL